MKNSLKAFQSSLVGKLLVKSLSYLITAILTIMALSYIKTGEIPMSILIIEKMTIFHALVFIFVSTIFVIVAMEFSFHNISKKIDLLTKDRDLKDEEILGFFAFLIDKYSDNLKLHHKMQTQALKSVVDTINKDRLNILAGGDIVIKNVTEEQDAIIKNAIENDVKREFSRLTKLFIRKDSDLSI